MKKLQIKATDAVLTALGLVFLVGMLTVVQPCGPTEDGGWMTCHWAGQTLALLAAALLALGILRLFVSPEARTGIDIAVLVIAAAALCVPGRLFELCMMPQMRCRALTAPGATVLSVLTLLAAAADLFMNRRRRKS